MFGGIVGMEILSSIDRQLQVISCNQASQATELGERGAAVSESDPNLALAYTGEAFGLFTVSGFQALGSIALSPIGFLLEKISKFAGEAIFQEMFLNPDKLDISYRIPNSKNETKGGVIVHHWRPEIPQIKMSGKVGWVRRASILDSAVNRAAEALVGGQNVGTAIADSFGDFGNPLNSVAEFQRFREQSRALVNSPRKFMEDLETLALSPMYYIDPSTGVERYNSKRIVIFTKRYPEGAVLDGYFDDFRINETGKDAETIPYSFTFTAKNIRPLTFSERIGQFFAPFFGTAVEVANVIPAAIGGF